MKKSKFSIARILLLPNTSYHASLAWPFPSQDLTPPSSTPAAERAPPSFSSLFACRSQKRCAVVLDEDTYIAGIENIIERGFFPNIPRLRDRLDRLEVIRSDDPIIIRDAQLKILKRRAAVPRISVLSLLSRDGR
ncbi:protein DGCR14 [Canna indica]|uniref:Protein DGCR14 n=1 Tax=Canna indica TaxID=4628 RepID=A0AAQ3QTD7_9LILI|nr:protein DGCR14 [Canna indica]